MAWLALPRKNERIIWICRIVETNVLITKSTHCDTIRTCISAVEIFLASVYGFPAIWIIFLVPQGGIFNTQIPYSFEKKIALNSEGVRD